jgi:ubiquinone/menaquinone biosynthesis C-methylase UbiE
VADMFSNAEAYERMMGRWSAQLADLFLNFVHVRDDERVLDVGCGTGSLMQALAERTTRGRIVGIDPTAPFIEYARSRFCDPRITCERGSAFDLPFPDASFDVSLSLLVLMLIPTPEKAVDEMVRVTRPGGVVGACTWDADGFTMVAALWDEAVRLDPAAATAAERPKHCNRAGQLRQLWESAGLQHVEETALQFDARFSSFDDYWSPFLTGIGPPGVYVTSLSESKRIALRKALRVRLSPDNPDKPFSLPARAWAVRGVVRS